MANTNEYSRILAEADKMRRKGASKEQIEAFMQREFEKLNKNKEVEEVRKKEKETAEQKAKAELEVKKRKEEENRKKEAEAKKKAEAEKARQESVAAMKQYEASLRVKKETEAKRTEEEAKKKQLEQEILNPKQPVSSLKPSTNKEEVTNPIQNTTGFGSNPVEDKLNNTEEKPADIEGFKKG